MKIEHMLFVAYIYGMMSRMEKGTLDTHNAASLLGIGVGAQNAICYTIASETPGWFITYTSPNVFGLVRREV